MYRWWLSLLILLLVPSVVFAQDAATPQPTPTLAPTPAPSPTPQPPASSPTNEIVVHRIIAGETAYTIAARYGITINDLYRLNNLNDDTILQIGQELIISGVVPLPLGVEQISNPALLTLPGFAPVPKIHQVQAGDTLIGLAERYGLGAQELQLVNGFDSETVLQLGMTVYIPNQTGDLFARNYAVQIGDTVDGIASRFNTSAGDVIGRNQLINPNRLIAGQILRIVSRTGAPDPQQLLGKHHIVAAQETLLTIAARYNVTPQAIATANLLSWPSAVTPGQPLRIPAGEAYTPLPAGLNALSVSEQPFRQGEAFSVYVETSEALSLTGSIRFTDLITPTQTWYPTDYEQQFAFQPFSSGYAAIVGLDAFTQPGLYTLELFTDDGVAPIFSQVVQMAGTNFGLLQSIGLADDVGLRAAEDAVLGEIYATTSAEIYWDTTQPFLAPLDNTAYLSAGYGAARSYAGAPVRIFHTGVDYAAPVNTPIKSGAAGIVVFSDFTQLRGNVVIVDHGWGIMSGYFHMEQRAVAVGDSIAAGQLLGALGNTGLSTGAHLHWDLRVRGVAVNGLQWLKEAMPNLGE